MSEIRLHAGEAVLGAAEAAVAVPEEALKRPDLIRTAVREQGDAGKHRLHTLVQIAVVDYEDRALSPRSLPGETPLRIETGGEAVAVARGAALWLDDAGRVHAAVHEGLSLRPLLKAAHRFCTRFIRLDVR